MMIKAEKVVRSFPIPGGGKEGFMALKGVSFEIPEKSLTV